MATWIEYGVGVLITRSSNCVIRNVSCVDVFRKAAWGEYTNNLQVYDCDLTMNDPSGDIWNGGSGYRTAATARSPVARSTASI